MLVTESWMEHVAHESGIPPHILRQRNLYKNTDTTHYNQPTINTNLHKLWDQCMESSDYEARLKEAESFNAKHPYLKRGMSIIPTKFGIAFTATFLNQGSALVNVHSDGSVRVSIGGTEMGQGLYTKVVQVAADALGVSPELVYISETSTTTIPNASPTAASLGSDLYCMAVQEACIDLRHRLEGFRKDSTSFQDAVRAAYMNRVNLQSQSFYKVPVSGYNMEEKTGEPFSYWTSGVAASEVEVDCLTGDHRVIRSDVVMDVGRPINPMIDVGQIEGAFVQGAGWLTLEELISGDDKHAWIPRGKLLTRGPGNYKIPSMDDCPRDFRITLMDEVHNPRAVAGSRAVGEPPFFLGASVFFAIRSAIYESGKGAYQPFYAPATAERIFNSANARVFDEA